MKLKKEDKVKAYQAFLQWDGPQITIRSFQQNYPYQQTISFRQNGFALQNSGMPLAVSEAEDLIKYRNQRAYKVTTDEWYNAIDRTLICYYYAAKALSENNMEMDLSAVSEQIIHRYKNTKDDRCTAFATPPKPVGSKFSIPSFALQAELDLIHKEFRYPKNATNKLSSPGFLGAFFDRSTTSNLKLEDYIEYEYRTGLSLALEITAALQELNENTELKCASFRVFCNELLPYLARSHQIYTRNALARRFFHQVLIESNAIKYSRNPADVSDEHTVLSFARDPDYRALLIQTCSDMDSAITFLKNFSPQWNPRSVVTHVPSAFDILNCLPPRLNTPAAQAFDISACEWYELSIPVLDEQEQNQPRKKPSWDDVVNAMPIMTPFIMASDDVQEAKQDKSRASAPTECPLSEEDCVCLKEAAFLVLQELERPFNLHDDLANLTRGWALFCNLNHPHIEKLITMIAEENALDYLQKGKFKGSRAKESKDFIMVHQAICAALKNKDKKSDAAKNSDPSS